MRFTEGRAWISTDPQLKPKLSKFLSQFDDCFPRKDTRAHLPVYIAGQLSTSRRRASSRSPSRPALPRGRCRSSSASSSGTRTGCATGSRTSCAAEHAGPHTIGIIDETSDVKKGDKTPGVQTAVVRRLGKTENCMVTVHLGYARDDFHCLLDGELFLPEGWVEDRDRCREAGIPDDMSTGPSGRSPWNCTTALWPTACTSTG